MSGIVLNNTPKKIDKGRDRILNNSPPTEPTSLSVTFTECRTIKKTR